MDSRLGLDGVGLVPAGEVLSETVQVLSGAAGVLSVSVMVLSVSAIPGRRRGGVPRLPVMSPSLTLPVPVALPDHARPRLLCQPLVPVRHPPARRVARLRPTPRPTPADQLQVVVAILEALFGHRPLHQVGRLLSEPAFGVVRLHRQTGRWQGGTIASVKSQEPRSGAAEVSVRLILGGRSLACAMRLDHIGRRWLCSDIQLAG